MDPFPLKWPDNFDRTHDPVQSKFKVASIAGGRDKVIRQLNLMGASNVVITSNMALNRDGLPSYRQGYIDDTGVAVYYDWRGERYVIPSDQYIRVEDNLHAVGLTLEALRGIERWGTGQIMRAAFSGFKALPAPVVRTWAQVLELDEVGAYITENDIRNAYKRLASKYHPDRPDGDEAKFKEVLAAYQEGLKAVNGR